MHRKQTAYLAPEGYEAELREELGPDTKTYGRLLIAEGAPRPTAWAQNVWLDPVELPIRSISDAAKQLRALGPRWAVYSHQFHRRAQLIQEQLPKVRQPQIEFLKPIEKPVAYGSWTLLDQDRMLASVSCVSPFPNGEFSFVEDKESAPSRAYLKLWELFTLHGVHPEKGDTCLDLGASPGGWTWVLAKLGSHVTAVDRATLDPRIMKMPHVKLLQRSAFTLPPSDIGKVDWLFSDIICDPKELYKLVQKWRESGLCQNFVCTLKFKGATDFATTREFAAIPGSHIKHLYHNKHELTWWLTKNV